MPSTFAENYIHIFKPLSPPFVYINVLSYSDGRVGEQLFIIRLNDSEKENEKLNMKCDTGKNYKIFMMNSFPKKYI